ncbi:hypothetical protein [Entomomonas asaccharolytica]|uniref:Lipoprotein n=1 Tax=Entomomonas asaccharolytica TaxID=2785331 RepID=A0A974NDS9_9GAMM|nr:hypothetical protein [Entomomonas asaccharolytica]QQP84668.1 hypothetical protein JHT90_09625 [Entomomonas asaccharolytica]
MRTSIFILCFLLIGCTPKVMITPDKLPDAVVGELYYAEIEITGGSGPVTASGFKRIITPPVLWVEPNYEKDKREGSFYNSLTVKGIPKTTEDITIKISGYMIPSGWSTATSKFEKTYIIKVRD